MPPGRLYAIADLHLSHKPNREALECLVPHPDDTLILAGDVGESVSNLHFAFEAATKNFKQVIWVPGNHELYTLPPLSDPTKPRGEAKYSECVAIAREHGVITPEDEFVTFQGEGGPAIVAPIFTLYDYSFAPDGLGPDEAKDWAREEGIEATDEALLFPDPHQSRQAWCNKLVDKFEAKLEDAKKRDLPLIIVNHWPLRKDLVNIPLVPRFVLWCGTKKTEDWHKRFNAKVVVTGHLHVPRTDWIDGVRFEECSLGYPKQWIKPKEAGLDVNDLLREILPGPDPPEGGNAPPKWRRMG